MIKTLPCIACRKPLGKALPSSENLPSSGLAFTSDGHYGSEFDPMNGQYLEINVCDDCLRKAAAAGRVAAGRVKRAALKLWRP